MQKEQLKDREINYVEVCIITEAGSNPSKGEYGMGITSFIGTLNISARGMEDDISLIKECIEENIDDIKLPEEGTTQVILRESGEWEDVFWHKYYEIEKTVIIIP